MNMLVGRNLGSFEPKGAVGAVIASATTITIPAFGNYFSLTGTTNVTGMVVKQGRWFILQTSGVLTISDGANIDLGGKDFITSPGDTLVFYAPSDSLARLISFKREGGLDPADLPSGSVVQTANVQDSATATGTTLFPTDDTVPQNTEGDQYMSLAFTPTNANNKLLITVVINLMGSTATNQQFGVGLFQDSTAGALAAQGQSESSSTTSVEQNIVLTHFMTAGTAASTTFKVRAGMTAAGTTTFNNNTYGGVMASSITIQEIAA